MTTSRINFKELNYDFEIGKELDRISEVDENILLDSPLQVSEGPSAMTRLPTP